jgi:hypothetical protein
MFKNNFGKPAIIKVSGMLLHLLNCHQDICSEEGLVTREPILGVEMVHLGSDDDDVVVHVAEVISDDDEEQVGEIDDNFTCIFIIFFIIKSYFSAL